MMRVLLLNVVMALILGNAAAAFDEAAWTEVLQDVVSPAQVGGMTIEAVNYPAVKTHAKFPAVVASLEASSLDGLDRHATLALLMNAYNVYAIKMVADNWPLKSIKDAGSWWKPVWKKTAGKIGGKKYSLDNIEDTIRDMGDYRIHACINCASVSCPDLRTEAFAASEVDEQMTDQMRKWLAHPVKGSLLGDDRKSLKLSKIFDWFKGDFTKVAPTVLDFIVPFLPEDSAKAVREAGVKSIKLSYFDYDWNVNAAPAGLMSLSYSEDTAVSVHPYLTVDKRKMTEFEALAAKYFVAGSSEDYCLMYSVTLDKHVAHMREQYEDADALLDHMDDVADLMDETAALTSPQQTMQIHATAADNKVLMKWATSVGLDVDFYTLIPGGLRFGQAPNKGQDHVSFHPWWKIHDLDNFFSIVEEMYDAVRDEKTALYYSFSLNEDKTIAYCREGYPDAKAALGHRDLAIPFLQRIEETAAHMYKIQVQGPKSELATLKPAFDGTDVEWFATVGNSLM